MEIAVAGQAAAFWSGLHLILLLVLSVRVVRQRRRHAVALGDGGVPELERAIRAFGNAAEYVPAGLAAFGVLAVAGAHPIALHVTGAVMLAGRLMHAVGLSNSGEATLLRSTGVLLTWAAWLFAAALLLFYAIA